MNQKIAKHPAWAKLNKSKQATNISDLLNNFDSIPSQQPNQHSKDEHELLNANISDEQVEVNNTDDNKQWAANLKYDRWPCD